MIEPAASTVGLIGLGQIGGSLGLDLVDRRAVRQVIGYDVDEPSFRRALERKAVDSISADLKSLAAEADLIVIATPIRATLDLIPKLGQMAGEGTAITDVAGTKGQVLQAVAQSGLGPRYVSVHPMAGSEGAGIDSARIGLFEGRVAVITPGEDADSNTVALVEALWRSVGAETVRMDAEEHDRAIALTSHLPYAVAVALAQMGAEETGKASSFTGMLAGSFASATRVAASSPELTLDMWLTNRDATANRIQRFADRLSSLAELIHSGDETELRRHVEKARTFVSEMSRE